MADFEPPSFSLGFDFDLPDTQPQPTTQHTNPSTTILEQEEEYNDFETLTVVDSDSEDQDSYPKLKRLRRGAAVGERVAVGSGKSAVEVLASVVVDGDNDDDDIDDFSSPEDEHVSTHRHSVCNSSKIPLSGHVLSKQPGKRKQNMSNDPESVITSCNKPPFPKPTASPLRGFQLFDSDSDFDDPFFTDDVTNSTSKGSDSSLKKGPPVGLNQHKKLNESVNTTIPVGLNQHKKFSESVNTTTPVGLNQHKKLNESVNTTTAKDLWEDFQPEKSFHVPTPAFDEVYEEFYSSKKDKSKSQSNIGKSNESVPDTSIVIDLDDSRPPAHQYFFHIDPRVQDLVRTRLPNYFPLNAVSREQASTSNIDYMGQFSQGAAKCNPTGRINKPGTSSVNNSKNAKTQETSQSSTRRRRNTEKRIPKDAGKRRVQADGQAASASTGGAGGGAGHWFTNQDGKKVYVSNNGQELTGRAAYMLFKKERGGGFKSKKAKKSATKKK